MDREKAVRFYGSMFALLCLFSAIVLLPLPFVLAFRVAWPWIFLIAAYPSLALTWAFLYRIMTIKLGGNNREDNQTIG